MKRDNYNQPIDDCRCRYDVIYEDALDRWTNEGGRPGVVCCRAAGASTAGSNWYASGDQYAGSLHLPA
jgi:hypothetical protein